MPQGCELSLPVSAEQWPRMKAGEGAGKAAPGRQLSAAIRTF